MKKKSYRKKIYEKCLDLAKKIAKKRDKHTCQRCGRKTNIHGSHIINEAKDHRLSIDPENIKALCYNCHLNWWHKNPLDAADRFNSKRPERHHHLKEKQKANQGKSTIKIQRLEDRYMELQQQALEMKIIKKISPLHKQEKK